jgi:fatty acid desaturase
MNQLNDDELINKAIDNLSRSSKFLTFSWERAMIAVWMLAMAFGAAGFIWYGIAAWQDPFQSIVNIALGIWIILLAVMRIVQKELENGGKQEDGS